MAVSINGNHPFMVRGRRTARLSIVLPHGDPVVKHEFTTREELEDHQDPTAPCALLKACIIASGILDDEDEEEKEKEGKEKDEDEEEGKNERENNSMHRSSRRQRPRCLGQQGEQEQGSTTRMHDGIQTCPQPNCILNSNNDCSNMQEGCTTTTTTAMGYQRRSTLACASSLPSSSLVDVLRRTGGGIEMEMTSTLPVGSGMGTSSILAAAALAVLSALQGHAPKEGDRCCDQNQKEAWKEESSERTVRLLPLSTTTTDRLLAKTLEVEQRMRTGGGWQDQVGGVLPGIKVGAMERQGQDQPLQLRTRLLDVTEKTIEDLDRRLLLIYTGQTRLAANLLQTVLAQWASREPLVVQTMRELVEDAELCESRLENGNLVTVGEIMTKYFSHKRFLSSTRLDQPPVVAALTKLLAPYMDGSVLAGAGGGGFLAVLLREGVEREAVVQQVRRQLAQDLEALGLTEECEQSMWAWHARIDRHGLCVRVEE
ncbi:hypothetical protein BGZ73_005566 [Actinomortierella ambigua]|nr:hypothetical protein BGZ73_005566 [Actinomortierella ambigua]